MKAITILQPWAGLIACETKQIETRSWQTRYRGPIAIHAGKDQDKKNDRIRHVEAKINDFALCLPQLEFGKVIAIASLVDCIKMDAPFIRSLSSLERVLGWYECGRYAWILSDITKIRPIAARGYQGLWNFDGRDIL